jgi:hypothetical protein
MLAAAANRLTFAPDRSSAGPKVLVLLMAAAVWAFCLVEGMLAGGGTMELAMAFQVGSCVLLGVGCLVWLTDDRHVPRRHRRWVEHRFGLLRRLYVIVRNGPLSTLLYLLLSMGLVAVGGAVLWLVEPGRSPFAEPDVLLLPVPLTVTYVLYVTGIAGVLTHLLPARHRTPSTRKVFVGALVVLNILPVAVVPMLAMMDVGDLASPVTALFPLLYLISLAGGVSFSEFVLHMIAPFAIGVACYALTARRLREGSEAASSGTDAP